MASEEAIELARSAGDKPLIIFNYDPGGETRSRQNDTLRRLGLALTGNLPVDVGLITDLLAHLEAMKKFFDLIAEAFGVWKESHVELIKRLESDNTGLDDIVTFIEFCRAKDAYDEVQKKLEQIPILEERLRGIRLK